MEQRGRKSAESLNVLSFVPGQRPPPPESLTESQAELWRRIVATKPAEWFTADIFPLLEQYVVAAHMAAIAKKALEAFATEWLATEEGVERFKELTAIYTKWMGSSKAHATSMRLTPQSRYDAKTAATAAKGAGKGGARPWESKPSGN